MIISLIAALSKNSVIGKNNDLPWRLPADMKYFMQTTSGHCVLMGRKNYESLPPKFRPLPNRTNLLVTKQKDYIAEGCLIFHAIDEAVEFAKQQGEPELFVIGGAEIYKATLPIADKLYLTEIDAMIDGDTYFPAFDKSKWKETSRTRHAPDEKHKFAFDFVVYQSTNYRIN